MKKLMLILLGIIFIGANLLAQVTARTVDQHVLSARKTFYTYTGVAADTVGTDKDTLYFELQVNKTVAVNVNARIEVTRTGTTDTYDMDLEAKVFENDSWTKLLEYATQSASKSIYDTCGVVQAGLGTPTNFYRYFRVFIGSDGDVLAGDNLTIDYIIWKVYER